MAREDIINVSLYVRYLFGSISRILSGDQEAKVADLPSWRLAACHVPFRLRWTPGVTTLSTDSSPASDAEPPRPWLHRVAGALSHRNFRIVWFAALGSTIGTWMQNFAQSWLVFDLTGTTFSRSFPSFFSC